MLYGGGNCVVRSGTDFLGTQATRGERPTPVDDACRMELVAAVNFLLGSLLLCFRDLLAGRMGHYIVAPRRGRLVGKRFIDSTYSQVDAPKVRIICQTHPV